MPSMGTKQATRNEQLIKATMRRSVWSCGRESPLVAFAYVCGLVGQKSMPCQAWETSKKPPADSNQGLCRLDLHMMLYSGRPDIQRRAWKYHHMCELSRDSCESYDDALRDPVGDRSSAPAAINHTLCYLCLRAESLMICLFASDLVKSTEVQCLTWKEYQMSNIQSGKKRLHDCSELV